VPREQSGAFAPGRVNLIGEHTDYNRGLALPFAIAQGVTVRARACDPASGHAGRVVARALDLGESDEFELSRPGGAEGWRAVVRGIVAELTRAGYPLIGASVEIAGDVPRGAGLSSSAALEVALALALIDLGAEDAARDADLDKVEIACLCARVESEWVGAQTGLLDQLASLYGQLDTASEIDFAALSIEPVPLRLSGWRLVVADSGERHTLASSGYNQRRVECREASELLGVASLRDASAEQIEALPKPLRERARHVLDENERVTAAVAALRAEDLPALAALLNASHASLRDLYEVSTPAVERAVQGLLDAGAAGARLIGGGFGGSVLGLFAPTVEPPEAVREVRPCDGARVLEQGPRVSSP
jgi:galactokinase